jgi:hypothetical protein
MEKDTLQVDPWASRDLEGDFATFETENGDANDGHLAGALSKMATLPMMGPKSAKCVKHSRLPLSNLIHFGTSQA